MSTKNIFVQKQTKCKEVTPLSANKFNYSRMRLVNEFKKKKNNVRGSIFMSISLLLSFNFREKLSGKKRTKERTDKQ